MTTCFDCKHRNIHETEHEWIECHCKCDGRWHNPYRPETFYNKDCPNWARIGDNDERNTDDRTTGR